MTRKYKNKYRGMDEEDLSLKSILGFMAVGITFIAMFLNIVVL